MQNLSRDIGGYTNDKHTYHPTAQDDILPTGLDCVPTEKARQIRFNRTLAVIILICVLLVPVILAFLYFGPALTLESAVQKCEKFLDGQELLTESMAPAEYWDYLSEKTDRSRRAVIQDAQRGWAPGYRIQWFGAYVFSLEVASQRTMSKEESQGLLAFFDEYGIRPSRIKNCEQLVLKATYEGTSTETYTQTAFAVQIDLFWYIVVNDPENNIGYTFLFDAKFS